MGLNDFGLDTFGHLRKRDARKLATAHLFQASTNASRQWLTQELMLGHVSRLSSSELESPEVKKFAHALFRSGRLLVRPRLLPTHRRESPAIRHPTFATERRARVSVSSYKSSYLLEFSNVSINCGSNSCLRSHFATSMDVNRSTSSLFTIRCSLMAAAKNTYNRKAITPCSPHAK